MAIRRNISPKTSIWIINTENTGSGASVETDEYSYRIPTDASGQYNFTVDWGDGTINTITSYNQPEISHSYATKGEKTIYITGQCDRLWWSGIDRDKIIDITRWGDITTNIGSAFQSCENFIGSATDLQNTNFIQNGTSIQEMFRNCSVFNGKIGRIPGLTGIQQAFRNCFDFNQPINHLDVSGVSQFDLLFQNCQDFNQPLNQWDMSSAQDLRYMFNGASKFNQDISNWDVSNVSDFSYMFLLASKFNNGNSPNINNWNISKATNMYRMFRSSEFNQPLNNWIPISCSDFGGMFTGTPFNQDLSSWSSSFQASDIDMGGMFSDNNVFNNGGNPNINDWDVSNVTSMQFMFDADYNFNQPLNDWNVTNVTTMRSMFRSSAIDGLFNQPLDKWKPVSCETFQEMFRNSNFNQDLSAWSSSFQASNISFQSMFLDCLFNQSLGAWQIQNVTNMTEMLNNCGMSRENYEDTLISWSLQAPSIQSGVSLGATNLEYSGSDATVSASRAVLINDYGWTISGDINVG